MLVRNAPTMHKEPVYLPNACVCVQANKYTCPFTSILHLSRLSLDVIDSSPSSAYTFKDLLLCVFTTRAIASKNPQLASIRS